ncbi:putative quinol monooxygenase [uncultured Alistipes sp.]|uniref:putative quinol monooxygenase n=1 Tax=uncultured Alistipes sp. TaxID=538949 RepID=UPI001FA11D02|nr:putative quinol monooxygenase [uncultured Alistipes sp.]HJC26937.1 antibiotic biosynthesis monooxygenase [Candidatus Alistipes stercoravium]
MIRLNVFIRTTESNREELIATARELVAASLKDEGCVAYDLFESSTRRDVLMICETWSDAKALAAHEQAAHFTTLVPRIQQLGEMKIEKFVF